MVKTKNQVKSGGLAGVVVGDSSICLCEAKDESLLYRGYPIEELAEQGCFEEVSWLLLRGEIPTISEVKTYQKELRSLRYLPKELKKMLETIPADTNMMDVLRTGCSILGNLEPERADFPHFGIADRLTSCLSSMLLYWYQFHSTGKRIEVETNEDTTAGHILHLLLGKSPSPEHRRCLDLSMILYAEHEFNASTFTVRTIASTQSDFYSCICGGIGALRGPLHGGANEKAMDLIESFSSVVNAEKEVKRMLNNHEIVMGFGHRVYTRSDPRSLIIKEWAKKLSQHVGDTLLFPVAERIEQVMWKEKRLFPNLDFYSALVYHFLGIPTPFFTPIFVFSRIVGWSSHLLEQRDHNKLIRPLSHYTGHPLRHWNHHD